MSGKKHHANKRQLTVTWDNPFIGAETSKTMTGLDYLRTLPAGTGYSTIELKINFIRPLSSKTGKVLCEARVIHTGGRIATAEGKLVDKDSKLYAHATTTCIIFDPRGR